MDAGTFGAAGNAPRPWPAKHSPACRWHLPTPHQSQGAHQLTERGRTAQSPGDPGSLCTGFWGFFQESRRGMLWVPALMGGPQKSQGAGIRSPVVPWDHRWEELSPSPPAQLGKLIICKAISIANQLEATHKNKPRWRLPAATESGWEQHQQRAWRPRGRVAVGLLRDTAAPERPQGEGNLPRSEAARLVPGQSWAPGEGSDPEQAGLPPAGRGILGAAAGATQAAW